MSVGVRVQDFRMCCIRTLLAVLLKLTAHLQLIQLRDLASNMVATKGSANVMLVMHGQEGSKGPWPRLQQEKEQYSRPVPTPRDFEVP